MTRADPIPVPASGGYGAALPGGLFAGHAVDGVRTHLGLVPLPRSALGGNPQFPLAIDLHPGGVRFICAGSLDDHAHEWDGAGWIDHGPIYGSKPVLYDWNGTLLFVRGPSSIGAPSGLRQIADDGHIVTVDQSRTQSHPYEWTTRQHITIGQGKSGEHGEDPCVARMPDGTYRLIRTGKNWHIKFAMTGDDIALAMVEMNRLELYFIWLTRAELDALPRWDADDPTPICELVYVRGEPGHCLRCGHPKSVHTVKDPEEEPVAIPNHFYIVQAVNDLYPHLLQSNTLNDCGIFTERAVRALHATDANWGHVKKSPGQTQFNGHAADAVMYRTAPDRALDIIAGAENHPQPGSPAWQEVTSGGQAWLDPAQVEDVDGGDGGNGDGGNGGGGSTSNTVSVPTAAAYAALLRRVEAVEAAAKAADAKAQQALDQAGSGAGLKYGDKVAIAMDNGRVLCAEGGGPTNDQDSVRFTSRDAVGSWEQFTLEQP